MPDPNAVVATVVRIDQPVDRSVDEMVLDVSHVRHVLPLAGPDFIEMEKLLRDAMASGNPVIVTEEEDRLLIPQVVRVIELRATSDGGFDVRLEPSAARHQLRPALPDFAGVESELRRAMNARAPAVVTDDDAHDILHARLFVPGLDGVLPPPLG